MEVCAALQVCGVAVCVALQFVLLCSLRDFAVGGALKSRQSYSQCGVAGGEQVLQTSLHLHYLKKKLFPFACCISYNFLNPHKLATSGNKY